MEIKKSIGNDQLNIQVEESEHFSLTAADINNELVMLDNIYLPNGESYAVTKVSEDGSVELMRKDRVHLKKDQINDFLKDALIDRAECFMEEND